MKRTILILIAICSFSYTKAATSDLKKMYSKVDYMIEHAKDYAKEKEQKLKIYKTQLRNSSDIQGRYNTAYSIYQEYYPFNNDSALHYIRMCIDLSKTMQREDLYINSHIDLVRQYSNTGFYNDALYYLNNINRSGIPDYLLAKYYLTCSHLYGDMKSSTKDRKVSEHYDSLSTVFLDSLFVTADKNSIMYLWKKTDHSTYLKDFKTAQSCCDKWMKSVVPDSHDFATMAYFRARLYDASGNQEMRKYWLCRSAIADIQNAVLDQGALWSLANILMKEGDVQRAYKYINYSYECANNFSSHIRGWQISPIQITIDNKYKELMHESRRNLLIMTIFLSLLMVFLLFAVIYVQKKRKNLAEMNRNLAEAKEELNELNRELSQSNDMLGATNKELDYANRMKNEYIGEFLNTCSKYIDKLDNYRLMINRKLKAGQLKDLAHITSTDQLRAEEQEKLFKKFDTIFLNLFPTFVEEFNKLLKPEAQIVLPTKNMLTTDLRIFALIRLGISNSSQIASFLHYSPNSIYNYRARIKNKAVCPHDKFEERVMQIGLAGQPGGALQEHD